ncbi:MAG: aminotransferase class IV [Luteolibacter sp.]
MNEMWCNGEWRTDLSASPMDRGHTLGLGLFETLLAVDGKVHHAKRHLLRLARGCERLGWEIPFPNLPEIMAELLVRRGLENGRVRLRLALTAGSGAFDDLSQGSDFRLWIAAFPAPEPPLSVTTIVSPWPRNEHSPLAGLKCASYAENLIVLDYARRQGFDEVIFLNTAKNLCETATANLFVVKGGEIFTPALDSGCLPGISREILLEKIHARESSLRLEDLHSADEVFFTSSTRGAVPIVKVGDRHFPVGKVTREMNGILNHP